ncbi:hypothetical protein CLOM_g6376 [Closterium sp. NIES-68]|nr:hypothetical protein CLOM_g6376 [Closterium sp. NIES-68]
MHATVDDTPKDIDTLCANVPPELATLIRRYPDIFPDDLPAGLPPERPQDHKIDMEPGAQPTVRTQWRLTQPELTELRSQLDYLLEKGFIRPSTSQFAAPILFTPKKDGGLRMCIDYRALNRRTIQSRYPIPRADDLLDQLRGARFYSKIDLRGGYHQIRVFANDCHKTTFRTRYGSYEYTVMPFGLTNAPSTFQLTMNWVFRDLLDKCVIVYLDDILIYSKTHEQHLTDLEQVSQRLQEHRLITKGSKCEFLKSELEFLGHVVGADGIKIDSKKITTIRDWKPPTNLQELQSFLGFVNYVRRFIPNMAGITGPLTDVLRKGTLFEWGERQQTAFDELRNFLTSSPVLRIADPSRPFKVLTDASDFAIGAILLQDSGEGLQPIAYESRKLQASERNYPVHDKEMLAIVHAFKVWRCYLPGADVTVRTDHKSLQYLRAQPNLNPRQIRWLDFLESNFHDTITYKRGANNITDALTRPSAHLASIIVAKSNPLLTGLFTHGYTTDPFFTRNLHQQATTAKGPYFLKAKIRICVPDLPTHEVFSTAASWTAATARATPTAVATRDDGLRHGPSGNRNEQRRRPRRRRLTDEDGAFCTLSHNNHSRGYRETFHLHRCPFTRLTISDHQRPRPKNHVQVLARNKGLVWHTPPIFLRLSSSNRRPDRANQSNHGVPDTHQLPRSCPVGRIPAHAGIFLQQCPIGYDQSLAVFPKLRDGSDRRDDYPHRQPNAT